MYFKIGYQNIVENTNCKKLKADIYMNLPEYLDDASPKMSHDGSHAAL